MNYRIETETTNREREKEKNEITFFFNFIPPSSVLLSTCRRRPPNDRMNMVTISYHTTLFLVLALVSGCQVAGNREHKVHNIVLYPDKHSWCTTLPIKQVISAETDGSCKSIEIDNNVCVGACFSYSIPRTEPNEGEVR
jgi:DAN domain